MNLKELEAKRAELLGTVKTVLAEATVALAGNDMVKAAELQERAAGYQKQVEMYSTQIKSLQAADAADAEKLVVEPAAAVAEPVTKSEPVRMPFDTASADEPKANDVVKSVYVTKYGDENTAVKGLINDLYGNEKDYMNRRLDQQNAFVKYIRTGRLNGTEEGLLKTVVLLPDQIAEDVKNGADYRAIKATIQESVGDLGGYLVPEDYRVQMIKKIADTGVVRQYARKVTTMRDSVEWPKLLGGDDRYTSAVTVTWIDENPADASVALTNPTFGMEKIPIHTAMARVDMSRNQLEDSAFNMIAMMSELFGEAAAIDEDVRFITGTGGNTPLGVFGARSGAEEIPVTGISVVNSGASSTLTPDGVIDLIYSLPQQYRGGAILMGTRTTHAAIRKFKDTTGQYLWEPALRAGEPPTVLGYPFYESESIPTVGVNKYPLVFGNFNGYVIADRVGMTIERVADTNTIGQNKIALFMRRRLGGAVVEPWRFKAQKVSA
jgi:HK97 family phage major capsid protein